MQPICRYVSLRGIHTGAANTEVTFKVIGNQFWNKTTHSVTFDAASSGSSAQSVYPSSSIDLPSGKPTNCIHTVCFVRKDWLSICIWCLLRWVQIHQHFVIRNRSEWQNCVTSLSVQHCRKHNLTCTCNILRANGGESVPCKHADTFSFLLNRLYKHDSVNVSILPFTSIFLCWRLGRSGKSTV